MIRVTKPRGRVVLVDTDSGSFSVDYSNAITERAIQRSAAELVLTNGYSGRQLFRLLKDQRLEDVSVHINPICLSDYLTARELARLEWAERRAQDSGLLDAGSVAEWRRELREANDGGTFFGTLSIITVAGVVPSRPS